MTDDAGHRPYRLVSTAQLDSIRSVVGRDAVFEGDFTSQTNKGLRILGSLTGRVMFEQGGIVHVGEGASVCETVITADHILIEGRVTGRIVARRQLEIASTAEVVGSIESYGALTVHPSAKVHGDIHHRPG